MRRVRTLALALASLASAAPSDRALPVIGVSYSNGDTSKQASVGVASECFKMPGKVIAVACIDQKAATAIDQAKSKWAWLWLWVRAWLWMWARRTQIYAGGDCWYVAC